MAYDYSQSLNPQKALIFRIVHRDNLEWILTHGLWAGTGQQQNPHFVYLSTLNDIRDMEDEKKPIPLDINSRRAKMQLIEKRSLEAENKRLIATGERPYANWNTYQAAMDAKFEERSQMKESERPELPEDEAFIKEAAYIMLSADPKVQASPEEKL